MVDKKSLPFPEPALSEANKKKMDEIEKSIERAQVLSEFFEIKRMEPIYEDRRRLTMAIPMFWATVFLRHTGFAADLKNKEDVKALQHLTDIAIKRNPVELRVYTIEFSFSNNPYFENQILKKVYQFTESSARKKEPADREGFKWTMLDFDWDDDVKALPQRILWKSGRNLCTKYPKKVDPDGDVIELGSFFNWFESDGDVFDIGQIIAEEIFPDAIGYFNGEIDGDNDGEDEDEEDYEHHGEDINSEESSDGEEDEEDVHHGEDNDSDESADSDDKHYNTSHKSGTNRVEHEDDNDDNSDDNNSDNNNSDDNNSDDNRDDDSDDDSSSRNSGYNKGGRRW